MLPKPQSIRIRRVQSVPVPAAKNAFKKKEARLINQGIQKGSSKGYDIGFGKGEEKGYTKGFGKGEEKGYSKGVGIGIGKGLSHGLEIGVEKGLDKGLEVGYAKGVAKDSSKGMVSNRSGYGDEDAAASSGSSSKGLMLEHDIITCGVSDAWDLDSHTHLQG